MSDEEEQSYDTTGARLADAGPKMVLVASGSRDPLPDVADDEYTDILRIRFDKVALAELAVDQDHLVSGTASFEETFLDMVQSTDVTFVSDDSHIAAIEHAYFLRGCGFCGAIDSEQSIRGTLRLARNTATHLGGMIEVRVEGFVPGTLATNHDITVTFDLAISE